MTDEKLWKTVVAVAAGFLVAGAIGYVVRLWMVTQALNEMQRAIGASTSQMMESARLGAARQQLELAERAHFAQEEELRKRLAVAAQQRAVEDSKQAVLIEATAKENAWKRYYTKPAHCDKADGPAFVECANQYIRAKRAFDELYAAGKL